MAVVGGCPNGLALGRDGRVYFTQNSGGEDGTDAPSRGRQGTYTLDPDRGEVEQITTTADGLPLASPTTSALGRMAPCTSPTRAPSLTLSPGGSAATLTGEQRLSIMSGERSRMGSGSTATTV